MNLTKLRNPCSFWSSEMAGCKTSAFGFRRVADTARLGIAIGEAMGLHGIQPLPKNIPTRQLESPTLRHQKLPKMLRPPSPPYPQLACPLVAEEEIKGIRQSALLSGVSVSPLKVCNLAIGTANIRGSAHWWLSFE